MRLERVLCAIMKWLNQTLRLSELYVTRYYWVELIRWPVYTRITFPNRLIRILFTEPLSLPHHTYRVALSYRVKFTVNSAVWHSPAWLKVVSESEKETLWCDDCNSVESLVKINNLDFFHMSGEEKKKCRFGYTIGENMCGESCGWRKRCQSVKFTISRGWSTFGRLRFCQKRFCWFGPAIER